MNIRAIIKKPYIFLGSFLFFFLLFRLSSLFEPYWYGDEAVYQIIGKGIRAGRIIYTGVWDNKPPLLFYLYAAADGNQFITRLLSILFGILSIIIFFFLGKLFFRNEKGVAVSTALFGLFLGLPFLEGNIANTEVFMLLLIVLSAFLVYKSLQRNQCTLLFIAGISVGIAALFKIVGVIDTTAFGLFILFADNLPLPARIKRLGIFSIGWLIPIALTIIHLVSLGVFHEFLQTALFENVGYVGYGNQFIIPQGLLIVKLLLLSIASSLLILKRKSLSPSLLFIFLWLSFSLFNVFFSQRPYTHYLLLLVPSFSLLIGLFFTAQKLKNMLLITTAIITIVICRNFTLYWNVGGYYNNFISYVLGMKTQFEYQYFFDTDTPRDYRVVEYLKNILKPEDSLFIWGNNPQIYVLTNTLPPGRFAAAYHITGSKERIEETKKALEGKNPTYIVKFDIKEPFPYSLSGYQKIQQVGDAEIFTNTASAPLLK